MRRGYPFTLVLAASMVLAIAPGQAQARDHISPHDITSTTNGRAIAHDTAARWAAKGINVRDADLQVTQDDLGYVVAPKGLNVSLTPDGQMTWEAFGQGDGAAKLAFTGSRADIPTLGAFDMTPQVDWELQQTGSASRIYASSGLGYFDVAWRIWMLRPRPSGFNRDDFLVEYWGTATGNSGNGLEYANIRVKEAKSTAKWVDWAPGGSSSGGCRVIPLGVGGSYAAVGASISSNFQSCEELDMSKSNPAVDITESWDYCQSWCLTGMRGSRALKVQAWDYVPVNAGFHYYFYAGVG